MHLETYNYLLTDKKKYALGTYKYLLFDKICMHLKTTLFTDWKNMYAFINI